MSEISAKEQLSKYRTKQAKINEKVKELEILAAEEEAFNEKAMKLGHKILNLCDPIDEGALLELIEDNIPILQKEIKEEE